MAEPRDRDYPELREGKMLAIGIYGESVAAYRYVVLSERLPDQMDREMLAAIAGEEREHRARLEQLQARYYPDHSFYLSEDDKTLVLTGRRLIEVRDIDDCREVMRLALATELRVAQFYRAMLPQVTTPQIRAVFEEMAVESTQHHRRLLALASQRGLLPADA